MEGSRPEDPRSAGEARPQVPPEPGALGASGVPSARSQQLLTLRRGNGAAALETPRDPAAASPGQGKQGNMVMVWPQLVSIEFVAILVFTAMLLVLGTLVNAPLDLLANPDRTPNPSKAPWYFLNLQELLLHMHPALAGVIVPAAVVFVLIPLIPYIDRDLHRGVHYHRHPAGDHLRRVRWGEAADVRAGEPDRDRVPGRHLGHRRNRAAVPDAVPDLGAAAADPLDLLALHHAGRDDRPVHRLRR